MTRESKPMGWRWEHLIAAVGAAAALPPAIVAIVEFIREPLLIETPAAPQLPTDKATGKEPLTETPASTPPSGPSDPPRSAPPALPTEAPLGRALSPRASEACRTPLSATGSAWQVGRVVMSGRNYERAYFCNLYSAGVGSLDFVLGNSYRELRVTIGTADDSDWVKHRVKFEIIGDDKVYLAKTLEFGETRDLTVNVMGISRLKLNITELGPGTSDSPSRAVWASPIAVPRS